MTDNNSTTVTPSRALPADVFPESGCRLPLPARDDLDAAGQAVYDRLVDPQAKTIAGLRGPGGIQLHSPRLAELSAPLNHYLRWDTDFGGRVRELAVLVTAREFDSQFEWSAHEPVALREGIAQDLIDIIKFRRPLDGVDERDAVVIQLGREVYGAKKVSAATYARAVKEFGPRGLVDLVSLMGNYAATALLLATFDMQLRPGQAALLPESGAA